MKIFSRLVLFSFFVLSLSSCIGIRANFKFPDEYGESKWISSNNNIDILITVDENNDSYGFITYDDITNKYKVLFGIDESCFRCLNDNDEYILEDGTSILQEQYESNFPNNTSNVKSSSFYVTKTQNNMMECHITYEDFNYIFQHYESDDNGTLYFSFEMVIE